MATKSPTYPAVTVEGAADCRAAGTACRAARRPEEAARAVLFLACEATFTTGAGPAVDGGVSQL